MAGRLALRTRNGTDCSARYPEVVAGLASLHGRHLIDGEACVLDDIGRSDFERLQDRSRRRGWHSGADLVAFLAFDLLAHRSANIRPWPVERRKAALQRLLTPRRHRPCCTSATCPKVDASSTPRRAHWSWKGSCASGLVRLTPTVCAIGTGSRSSGRGPYRLSGSTAESRRIAAKRRCAT
jgi:ATP-dependent DNA ligase